MRRGNYRPICLYIYRNFMSIILCLSCIPFLQDKYLCLFVSQNQTHLSTCIIPITILHLAFRLFAFRVIYHDAPVFWKLWKHFISHFSLIPAGRITCCWLFEFMQIGMSEARVYTLCVLIKISNSSFTEMTPRIKNSPPTFSIYLYFLYHIFRYF